MKLEFSRQIFEKSRNTKFHENHLVGAELFHADRRTEITKLIVTFRNFVKANQLMLYRQVTAVCPENHKSDLNTVCRQNVEILNVKPGATYHYATKD
jgi:hypothetical protein